MEFQETLVTIAIGVEVLFWKIIHVLFNMTYVIVLCKTLKCEMQVLKCGTWMWHNDSINVTQWENRLIVRGWMWHQRPRMMSPYQQCLRWVCVSMVTCYLAEFPIQSISHWNSFFFRLQLLFLLELIFLIILVISLQTGKKA